MRNKNNVVYKFRKFCHWLYSPTKIVKQFWNHPVHFVAHTISAVQVLIDCLPHYATRDLKKFKGKIKC